MSTVTRVTPEDLLVLPDGKLFELVDGALREKAVSGMTSYLAARLIRRLTEFTDNGCGFVFGPDCGYRCFPDVPQQVRKPDVSFVSANRLAADEIGDGWFTLIPDLAVEFVSPNDVASELQRKLDDYSSAGIPAVWVVYPETSTAVVHRPDGTSQRLPQPVEFVGEGPLDGFRCTLQELMPPSSVS